METKNKSFEEYLSELDNVVRKLEDKSISLEDAVKNYSEGIELSKKCYEILNTSEELVVKTMTENGLEKFIKE